MSMVFELRWGLKATVFVALVACLLAISQTSFADQNDLIPTAIAIDLLVTVPIVYFLLIRNTAVPAITVVLVFFLSFFIGSTFMPNGLGVLSVVGAIVLPAIELMLLGYLGFRIFRTRKAYVGERGSGFDLMEGLRKAFEIELRPPALARAAAFEIAVFAYLIFFWRRPQGTVFTYHQRNSPRLLLALFLFLLVVETIALHFLVSLWNPTIAWVATALSLYVGVQLVAHFKALSIRPIVVTENAVLIRCGIVGDAAIPRVAIDAVSKDDKGGGITLLPLGGASQPNVRIDLKEPVAVFGVYGTKQNTTLLRICVDDPDAFVGAISECS